MSTIPHLLLSIMSLLLPFHIITTSNAFTLLIKATGGTYYAQLSVHVHAPLLSSPVNCMSDEIGSMVILLIMMCSYFFTISSCNFPLPHSLTNCRPTTKTSKKSIVHTKSMQPLAVHYYPILTIRFQCFYHPPPLLPLQCFQGFQCIQFVHEWHGTSWSAAPLPQHQRQQQLHAPLLHYLEWRPIVIL